MKNYPAEVCRYLKEWTLNIIRSHLCRFHIPAPMGRRCFCHLCDDIMCDKLSLTLWRHTNSEDIYVSEGRECESDTNANN